MDRVAGLLSAGDRRSLFREAAIQMGMNPAIVEKDFWVCWILKQVFADPELKDRMVFKGGTPLSKVFQIINRFSEDIDLVLDWRLLGLGPGAADPFQRFGSSAKQDKFNKSVVAASADYIERTLIRQLNRLFEKCAGVGGTINPDDRNTINVTYPAAFGETYLRPEVRLEIGPLASWVPSARHIITPYAALAFPGVFANSSVPVVSIAAERTFWEKATILHQEAHRTGPPPPRYSRHYYDMYKLAASPAKAALLDTQMLSDVVAFKQRFYPSKWARYDLAIPGSFKLTPNVGQAASLERDYRGMNVMIIGEAPPFEAIMDTLRDLETAINRERERAAG